MILRLGACEIDAGRRLIRRDGIEQRVARKGFDLLLVLLDERPKVVAKDELIKRVWPDTFVADANLAILVADLRTALGDHAREPRIIRTHHRVGYSFAADVLEVTAESDHRPPVFILAAAKRRIPLYEGVVVVGRDETCGVQIDHPSVSRRHALLTIQGQELRVEDCKSKNGTRVDDEMVGEPTHVTRGQRVKFGSVEFTVLDSDKSPTTVTVRGSSL